MAQAEEGMTERLVRMRVIWGAVVMSHFVFVVAAVLITQNMPEGVTGASEFPAMFGIVFAVLGLGGVGVSLLLRNMLQSRAERSSDPSATRFQSLIIGLALTDFASTLGLVHALLTGGLAIAILLFATAFVAAIWHFPLEG